MPNNPPPSLPVIPEAHIVGICKFGKKEQCCRYFAANASGYVCAKKVPDVRVVIDQRFAAGTLSARGDNCSGLNPP